MKNKQGQNRKQAPSARADNLPLHEGDAEPYLNAGYPDSPEQDASAARGGDLARGTLVDAPLALATPKVGKLQADAWQPTFSPGFQATN
eukprot:1966689-Rhodomonas_salina.2